MISLIVHLEHFVLQHSKPIAVCGSREVGVAFLAVGYLVLSPVVATGEESVGVVVIVATVCQVEVMATSKSRAITTLALDQGASINRDVLLLPVEGEQECPHVGVTEIIAA